MTRRANLLILDEPADGLDPVAIDEFLRELMSVAAEGTTVFFSSHQFAEVTYAAQAAGPVGSPDCPPVSFVLDLQKLCKSTTPMLVKPGLAGNCKPI